MRIVRRREGCYLLRSNLVHQDPRVLWEYYIQLTEVEQAFKDLKQDLAVRPVYHQTDDRIDAHIFVSFMSYCLFVTLKHKARRAAPGLTARAVLEKFGLYARVQYPFDHGLQQSRCFCCRFFTASICTATFIQLLFALAYALFCITGR